MVLLALAFALLNGPLGLVPARAGSQVCPVVKKGNTLTKVEHHPVLLTLPGKGLGGKRLKAGIFRQLNAENNLTNYLVITERYYGKVEREAAGQFCHLVQAKSKQYVETIAGRPRYRGGRVSCWPSSKQGEDIWLYSIGQTQVPVKLIFHNGLCSEAALYGYRDDFEFQQWRAKQICDFAVGKAVKQILAYDDQPHSSSGKFDKAVSPLNEECQTIIYETGLGTCVVLAIENQKCTKAYTAIIAH